MASTVTRKNGSIQPLFKNSKNQVVNVFKHEDGVVTVSVSGTNSKIAARVQKELDNTYGEGKYNVSTDTLTEKDGIVRGIDKDGNEGNIPGACAEPACAVAAGQHSSPIVGSATMWRGEGANTHPYTGEGKETLDDRQMDGCLTCDNENNKAIYQETATQNSNAKLEKDIGTEGDK